MNTTRIGVYTICKNESKFVYEWVKSMWCGGKGADRAYVLDTGSTDGTVERFIQSMIALDIPEEWLVIRDKRYDSFRFDVARNDNLAMTEPDADWLDALVSVDLDETMIPEFWDDLRATVHEHPDFNRVYYLYAWNHDEDGRPKRVFWYDKVHPVKGCRWIHPVHEELVVDSPGEAYRLREDTIYLHHWMDASKPRSSYLPLLELRAQEEPENINGLFYLMREYQFRDIGSLDALRVANMALAQMDGTNDPFECLPFFLIGIGDVYRAHGLKEDAEHFYRRAIDVGGHLRQPYISLATMLSYSGRHAETINLLDRMERRAPTKYSTWHECDYNWTWKPMQIRAVAMCWAGRYDEAMSIFSEAENLYINTPTDINEASASGFYDDWQWIKDFYKTKMGDDMAE